MELEKQKCNFCKEYEDTFSEECQEQCLGCEALNEEYE